MQQYGTRVLDVLGIVLALRPDKAGDFIGESEQYHHLVYKMGAQIVYRAAAGEGFRFPRGGRRRCLWPMAIEMSFEFDDAAQFAIFQQRREREEVGVPSSVLIHRQQSFMLLCNLDQLLGFFGCGCEGLFDDDMFALLQCQFAQFEMTSWDRGDDYHVDGWILDHFFAGVVGFDCRVVLLGVIVGGGVPLDYRVEGEGWDGCDQWYLVVISSINDHILGCLGVAYMKDFGGHAIADDGDVVGFGGYHRGE